LASSEVEEAGIAISRKLWLAIRRMGDWLTALGVEVDAC